MKQEVAYVEQRAIPTPDARGEEGCKQADSYIKQGKPGGRGRGGANRTFQPRGTVYIINNGKRGKEEKTHFPSFTVRMRGIPVLCTMQEGD